MYDRRQTERVKVSLEARWEGLFAQCSGLVVDLSATGCFILTSDRVTENELVRLELPLPTGRSLHLWGEVVYKIAEMGFALRFENVTAAEADTLELLIAHLREGRDHAATFAAWHAAMRASRG
jgi:hypothetical protein